jgi:hypothetical protein
MPQSTERVLDCRASDNVYLHKDFHGALCYSIQYLDERYGEEATKAYLTQVGETFFAPLSEALKRDGLSALEKHWQQIFSLEEGSISLEYEGDVLVLKVKECPAITHLRSRGQLYTDRYCETTVVVNEAVCRGAGYACSCTYEPGQGQCVQRFWKEA